MSTELPSTEQIFTETSRLVPLIEGRSVLLCCTEKKKNCPIQNSLVSHAMPWHLQALEVRNLGRGAELSFEIAKTAN